MTFGILCTGPDAAEYRDEVPDGLYIEIEGAIWGWYHDFDQKMLFPDRESAGREAASAKRYNTDWKYQVVATE